MNADELRAKQAPIKRRYKDTPEAAKVTSRAEAVLSDDDISCRIKTWAGETVAGLHAATGGDGSQACSADMLLEALVACAGTTLKAVATASGIALRHARVSAQGVWDARGTLGVDRSAPVGLTDIRLHFDIDTDAAPEKVKRLIETTERYCVILQTLRTPPAITTA
ncbi:MAG TPA: OsmC family protein [Acidisphaera sp.]|nr:OsmC family protein [Acidisphaera sp.]